MIENNGKSEVPKPIPRARKTVNQLGDKNKFQQAQSGSGQGLEEPQLPPKSLRIQNDVLRFSKLIQDKTLVEEFVPIQKSKPKYVFY